MAISAFIYRFLRAATSPANPRSARGRVRRFVGRHRLTDEERRNLVGYYRRNCVQSPAIITGSLGGHPTLRGQR
jgi:hypothetical protein